RLLGTIAWRRGEYDDAIVHLTQSANLWVRIAGPENRHTYDKLRMVAAVRFAAGEVEAALREQEQLLPAVRAKFGDDARLTGTIALDMISSLTRLGRLEAADEVLPLALHALAMHTRDHDPGVGYTLMAQAELERARGKVHVASEMCRNIVSVWRSTYGEQHP